MDMIHLPPVASVPRPSSSISRSTHPFPHSQQQQPFSSSSSPGRGGTPLPVPRPSRCCSRRAPNTRARRGAILSIATAPRSPSSSSAPLGKNDLLIVGPGVLGRIVAEQWKQIHRDCQVYGQSLTPDHHDELVKLGIIPLLRGSQIGQFPYIIFCAPPSRSADYPGEVRSTALSWNGKGSFIFTSSSAAYDCYDNGSCDEDSAVVPIGRSPKTDILLKAELEALDAGGCVVRLAGLYKSDRGAHVYWLRKGVVEARPDHILNLIHYEDAATLSIAILKKHLRGRVFLGCDNHPVSRQEIMDYVDRSGKFSKKFAGFTGTSGPLGKKLSNSKTRAEIGWEPKYPSFAQFLGLQD